MCVTKRETMGVRVRLFLYILSWRLSVSAMAKCWKLFIFFVTTSTFWSNIIYLTNHCTHSQCRFTAIWFIKNVIYYFTRNTSATQYQYRLLVQAYGHQSYARYKIHITIWVHLFKCHAYMNQNADILAILIVILESADILWVGHCWWRIKFMLLSTGLN